MSEFKVREPHDPVEGEFTLCQTGNLVQYVNGRWVKVNTQWQ